MRDGRDEGAFPVTTVHAQETSSWGVKLWLLCDSMTHYWMSFFVYTGAAKGPDKDVLKNGLGFYVVTKLMEMCGLLQKGYHIFVDNFFSQSN